MESQMGDIYSRCSAMLRYNGQPEIRHTRGRKSQICDEHIKFPGRKRLVLVIDEHSTRCRIPSSGLRSPWSLGSGALSPIINMVPLPLQLFRIVIVAPLSLAVAAWLELIWLCLLVCVPALAVLAAIGVYRLIHFVFTKKPVVMARVGTAILFVWYCVYYARLFDANGMKKLSWTKSLP